MRVIVVLSRQLDNSNHIPADAIDLHRCRKGMPFLQFSAGQSIELIYSLLMPIHSLRLKLHTSGILSRIFLFPRYILLGL